LNGKKIGARRDSMEKTGSIRVGHYPYLEATLEPELTHPAVGGENGVGKSGTKHVQGRVSKKIGRTRGRRKSRFAQD